MKTLRRAGATGIKGCIHHSDHGVQFTSNCFQNALQRYCYRTDMTGPGKCCDNAKVERINGILKHELGAVADIHGLRRRAEVRGESG